MSLNSISNNVPFQPRPVFMEFENSKYRSRNNSLIQNTSSVAAEPVIKVAPKKNPGVVQGTKNFIGSVKKAWIAFSEYTNGLAGGLLKGAAAGGLTYVAIHGVKIAKTGFKNIREQAPKLPGKVASAAVGLAVFGYSMFKASLNVSEKQAGVDHRYNMGHRFEK